jgi:hypothetical protein
MPHSTGRSMVKVDKRLALSLCLRKYIIKKRKEEGGEREEGRV